LGPFLSPEGQTSGADISGLRKQEELHAEPSMRHQFTSPHWSEVGRRREETRESPESIHRESCSLLNKALHWQRADFFI